MDFESAVMCTRCPRSASRTGSGHPVRVMASTRTRTRARIVSPNRDGLQITKVGRYLMCAIGCGVQWTSSSIKITAISDRHSRVQGGEALVVIAAQFGKLGEGSQG